MNGYHLGPVCYILIIFFFLPTAPFCKSLIQGLESNPLSRIVWRGIKPLFIGKLLYTPDTPAVQQVMEEVQVKFHRLLVISFVFSRVNFIPLRTLTSYY